MRKNNIFTFSFLNYMKRFGILELVLMVISAFLFPFLLALLIFLIIWHFYLCFNQTLTLDPFQVERRYKYGGDGISSGMPLVKIEKYYYINKMTSYRKNYLFITIFGDIGYRKKHIEGNGEENIKKVNSVKIYRSLKNEKEYIEALNKKLSNNSDS